jgi:hypothetical protein
VAQGEVLIEASGFCWLVRISYSGLAAGCLCRSQDMRYRHCSHVSVNDTVLQKRKTKWEEKNVENAGPGSQVLESFIGNDPEPFHIKYSTHQSLGCASKSYRTNARVVTCPFPRCVRPREREKTSWVGLLLAASYVHALFLLCSRSCKKEPGRSIDPSSTLLAKDFNYFEGIERELAESQMLSWDDDPRWTGPRVLLLRCLLVNGSTRDMHRMRCACTLLPMKDMCMTYVHRLHVDVQSFFTYVNFKIFTKVITIRLNTVADHVVRLSQTAFMQKRNILDRVVVLPETIHELHTKR